MPTVIRETTIGNALVVRIAISVCTYAVGAVVFLTAGAGRARGLAASVALRADADTIARFDAWTGMRANAGGGTDDFMADTAGVDCFALGSGIR